MQYPVQTFQRPLDNKSVSEQRTHFKRRQTATQMEADRARPSQAR
jgi:hypothetical protein